MAAVFYSDISPEAAAGKIVDALPSLFVIAVIAMPV